MCYILYLVYNIDYLFIKYNILKKIYTLTYILVYNI